VRYSTSEEFPRFIRAEYDRWNPVIKQAGARIGD
jgi:tripartite-type tricarboxylate transporter receptor subunit TctC